MENKILHECLNYTVYSGHNLYKSVLKVVLFSYTDRARTTLDWRTALEVAIDVASGLIVVPWCAWNTERAESLRHLKSIAIITSLGFIYTFYFTDWNSNTYSSKCVMVLHGSLHDFFGVSSVCRREYMHQR